MASEPVAATTPTPTSAREAAQKLEAYKQRQLTAIKEAPQAERFQRTQAYKREVAKRQAVVTKISRAETAAGNIARARGGTVGATQKVVVEGETKYATTVRVEGKDVLVTTVKGRPQVLERVPTVPTRLEREERVFLPTSITEERLIAREPVERVEKVFYPGPPVKERVIGVAREPRVYKPPVSKAEQITREVRAAGVETTLGPTVSRLPEPVARAPKGYTIADIAGRKELVLEKPLTVEGERRLRAAEEKALREKAPISYMLGYPQARRAVARESEKILEAWFPLPEEPTVAEQMRAGIPRAVVGFAPGVVSTFYAAPGALEDILPKMDPETGAPKIGKARREAPEKIIGGGEAIIKGFRQQYERNPFETAGTLALMLAAPRIPRLVREAPAPSIVRLPKAGKPFKTTPLGKTYVEGELAPPTTRPAAGETLILGRPVKEPMPRVTAAEAPGLKVIFPKAKPEPKAIIAPGESLQELFAGAKMETRFRSMVPEARFPSFLPKTRFALIGEKIKRAPRRPVKPPKAAEIFERPLVGEAPKMKLKIEKLPPKKKPARAPEALGVREIETRGGVLLQEVKQIQRPAAKVKQVSRVDLFTKVGAATMLGFRVKQEQFPRRRLMPRATAVFAAAPAVKQRQRQKVRQRVLQETFLGQRQIPIARQIPAVRYAYMPGFKVLTAPVSVPKLLQKQIQAPKVTPALIQEPKMLPAPKLIAVLDFDKKKKPKPRRKPRVIERDYKRELTPLADLLSIMITEARLGVGVGRHPLKTPRIKKQYVREMQRGLIMFPTREMMAKKVKYPGAEELFGVRAKRMRRKGRIPFL